MAQPTGISPTIRAKLLKLLTGTPEGMTASHLSMRLGISKRTTYNNLMALQKESKVLNCRPIWQLAQVLGTSEDYATPLSSNNIELHNLSYIITLIKKPFWWNHRNAKLIKLKGYQIRELPLRNNPYMQLMNDDYVIQLFKNSIIVMLRKSYRANDPYDCLIEGTNDFLLAYSRIEQMTGFKFFGDGIPQARLRTQHIVKLKDALAKRCTKEGTLFRLEIGGKPRLLIDMSHPRGIEGVSPQYAPDDMDRYLKFTEDIIQNNPPTMTELTKSLGLVLQAQAEITHNQRVFAENMASHIAAIKALAAAVDKLTKTVEDR
jgi:hypothetical protein